MAKPNPFLKPKKKPNPFLAKKSPDKVKPPKRDTTRKKPPSAKSDNPFVKTKGKGAPPMTEEQWDELRAAAHQRLEDAGVEVGKTIRISWDVDPAYGSERVYVGTVTELGNMLVAEPRSKSDGTLRLPVTGIKHVEVVTIDDQPKKPNPFMKAKS